MLNKTDSQLGEEVSEFLKMQGVETPMFTHNTMDFEDRKRAMEASFTSIMQNLGLDLKDDSLQDTPKRVTKMYMQEIFYGLDYRNFPKCTTNSNKFSYNEMLVEPKITVSSTCEHHFVCIDGFAKIAYIPKEKVIGLSKLHRVTEFFSKRPQVQERLTVQIYYALSFILGTEDVAVEICADHHCVKSRGIKDTNSYTITRKMGGAFNDPIVRAEFMSSNHVNFEK